MLLWLLYFSHNQRGGRDYISQADESGLIAQIAYTYVPVPMVFGIIVAAVGDNIVLLHPLGQRHLGGSVDCGGPIVYLLGKRLFIKAIGGPWLLSHFVGIVTLAVIFVAHDSLPSLDDILDRERSAGCHPHRRRMGTQASQAGHRGRRRLSAPAFAGF